MKTLNFDPTLFVFLGSSSAQVGWRLKKKLDQVYGELPIFRYLWVDTDSNTSDELKQWLNSGLVEKAYIGEFNGKMVIKNLDDYTEIKKWWPKDSKLTPGFMGNGASQVRSFGRLSLFRKFKDGNDNEGTFISKLTRSLQGISTVANTMEATTKKTDNFSFTVNDKKARVIFVFSPCGGTGSGISFDLAYLVRNYLNQQGFNSTIASVLIMPAVIEKAMRNFSEQQPNKIKANAYTWFKENDFLIKNQNWSVEYPGDYIDVMDRPFDLNFLIDIGNERGQFLNSEQDIFKMIAESLFLISSTPVAADADSIQINMGITNDLHQGKFRSYSSFASAALVFPKERIKKYCGAKLAEEVIRKVRITPSHLSPNQLDPQTIINQLGLSKSELINSLLSNKKVRNDNLEIIQAANEPGIALEKLREEMINDQIEISLIKEQIKKDEEAIIIEKTAALKHKIVELYKNEGPGYVIYLLDKLVEDSSSKKPTSITGIKKSIELNGFSEESLNAAKEELNHSLGDLQEITGSFVSSVTQILLNKNWKERFRKSKDVCIEAIDQFNQISLQFYAENSAKKIYDHLLNEVKNLRSNFSVFSEIINQAEDKLKEDSEKYLIKPLSQDNLFELVHEVVDKEYIEEYYERNSIEIDHLAIFSQFAKQQAFFDSNSFVNINKDTFANALQSATETIFASNLDNISLLDAIQSSYGDNAKKIIKNKLDLLINYCHPFWRYQPDTNLDPVPEGPSFLGIFDADSSLIPEEYRDHTRFRLVSTGLKDVIYLVRILHGVPSSLLTGVSEWKIQYDRHLKGFDPLHIISEARDAEELIPEKDTRSKNIFAFGMAFGYISNRGQYFYYDPEKKFNNKNVKPAKDNRLAAGRENAEKEFVKSSAWVEKVEELVEDDILQMGNKAAIEYLELKVAELNKQIDELPSDSRSRHQLRKEMDALHKLKVSLMPNR